MKIREVRSVVERVAAMHRRLGASESAIVLAEFGEMLRSWDDKTVAAFAKLAKAPNRHNVKT